MINTLKMSLKIDFNYAINSFIYNLKKTPILKNIIPISLYSKEKFKTFIRILGVICTSLRLIVFRIMYMMIIYYISKFIGKNISATFIHIFFVFSVIGMFINTSILSTSRKKYISVILFNMNAKEFMLSHYILSSITSFFLNTFILLFVMYNLNVPLYMAFILSLFSLFSKNIGEAISIYCYRKRKIKFLNQKLYFIIIGIGLLISALPIINIYFNSNIIILLTILSLILSIFSLIYILKVDDYKLIYKQLNTLNSAILENDDDLLDRQLMVNIREEDKKIDERKLKNKTGYDLFNTIFFERHKYILFRSAKLMTILLSLVFIITIIVIFEFPKYDLLINKIIVENIGWLVIVMYFINRGAIVTQAMFFNCDHSMLKFNFYRKPDVIVGLFKRRLSTLMRINLLPTIVIAIAIPTIIFLTGGLPHNFDYLNIFVCTIATSIFFSIHYLVIYYLFQPYNEYMKIKSPTYSIISFITYFVSYLFTKININLTIFCTLIIIFTLIYTVVALRLVYKKAPYTFKIK